ncbi:sensor histidine kinase [Bailinhaonella thermotolerans]|uniref:histidine kinase n=1 Tax=Bailinhaonella thermotolerans TaxID=1070861 RepID=A0A3A4ADK0_9ACTN|nr:histidine kinase [Bailinhaonella thermotolerans]RJL23683.1 sensor histidine kinase [Bailinhaonella thermotolerans]
MTGERPVRRRRTARDWVVDLALFCGAAWVGLVVVGLRVESGAMPPEWLFGLDQLSGALGCLALWLRRRWPFGLAVALALMSSYSEFVAGALFVALFSVAVHRPPRVAMTALGLSLVSGVVFALIRPEPHESDAALWVLGSTLSAAAVGWGLFVQHRRRLAESLRERAARAEEEARLRAEQAQHQAREAIAREIHDVLGHRLSLLSVHAGALQYRPDAPPEDLSHAAKVIRESAHAALQDLREVIGVLRAPVGELPQPTLADVHQLTAESARAGMSVSLSESLPAPVPDGPGRTAYRVVQEALTNARKHAPGARVAVRLSGAPGEGLSVEVTNTAARGPAPPAAGAGQGLIGLAERVSLARGRLEHGPAGEGGWRVAAWLPWPS